MKHLKVAVEAVGARIRTIKIFAVEYGRAGHCYVGHRRAGIDFMGDWRALHLQRRGGFPAVG